MTIPQLHQSLLIFLLLLPLSWQTSHAFTLHDLSARSCHSATQLHSDARPDIFPMSTRAMLVEKAKQSGVVVDTKASGVQGTYSPAGWSNRLGSVLTPACVPGVWTADRPFYWNKIDVGCRMTVVELPNDDANAKPDLWVHSPVGLDAPLRAAIDELGTVKYIVSPNYEHLKYAPMWDKAYPDAFMWGCPGLAERMPEVSWTGEVPSGILESQSSANLKNCWDFETIRPIHVDMELNPFTGRPFFNEVVFYHEPSKSLFVTDLYWNYPSSDGVPNSQLGQKPWALAPSVKSIPKGSRLWKIGMDKVYYPFYMNFMLKDTAKYDAMVDIILNEWDIETIVPAHGDLIRGRKLVKEVLMGHLRRK